METSIVEGSLTHVWVFDLPSGPQNVQIDNQC